MSKQRRFCARSVRPEVSGRSTLRRPAMEPPKAEAKHPVDERTHCLRVLPSASFCSLLLGQEKASPIDSLRFVPAIAVALWSPYTVNATCGLTFAGLRSVRLWAGEVVSHPARSHLRERVARPHLGRGASHYHLRGYCRGEGRIGRAAGRGEAPLTLLLQVRAIVATRDSVQIRGGRIYPRAQVSAEVTAVIDRRTCFASAR